MSKPIITIDNFDFWVVYDNTIQTTWGFSDIEGVDIMSEQWVAKAQKEVVKIIDVPDDSFISSFFEWAIEPRKTGARNYTYYLDSVNWRILQSDDTSTMTTYRSIGAGTLPTYSEFAVFQDHTLVYPYDRTKLASTYGFTTNENYYLTASGTTITLSSSSKQVFRPNCVWTIYLEQSTWVFQAYTVSSRTTTNIIELSAAYTGSMGGWMRGYFFRDYSDLYTETWDEAAVPTQTVTFNTKNGLFKPFLNYETNLYVWDWNQVFRINPQGTWEYVLTLQSSMVIKKLLPYGGKIIIIADDNSASSYNTSQVLPPEANSFIFVWDWLSQGADLIPANGHIISGIVWDNRLYVLMKTESQIVLAAYNGSDFTTIRVVSNTTEQQYPNTFATYRNALYMYITEWASNNYIYSYNAFGEMNSKLQKVKDMGTKLPWPLNFLLWFNKSTLKTEKRGNLIISVRWDGIYELKTNSTGNYQTYSDVAADWSFIITQTYEISEDQFPRLAKGLGIMCKEGIPAWCSIGIDYKLDNATSWTSIWVFNSTNQEYPKMNINRRGRRMTLRIKFYTNGTNTAKLIEIRIY